MNHAFMNLVNQRVRCLMPMACRQFIYRSLSKEGVGPDARGLRRAQQALAQVKEVKWAELTVTAAKQNEDMYMASMQAARTLLQDAQRFLGERQSDPQKRLKTPEVRG